MSRTVVAIVLAAATIGALPVSVEAQETAGYSVQSIVDGNVGHDAQGVLDVNLAAGDGNLQSNAMALAISNDGPALAQGSVVQAIDGGQLTVPDVAVARIDGGAFSNSAGAIGINQAAGALNAQANSVAIAMGVGIDVAADAELAQTISGVAPAVVAEGAYRETTVADTAFNGARGIVQVNQSAGVGNATANSFALRVQLGAP